MTSGYLGVLPDSSAVSSSAWTLNTLNFSSITGEDNNPRFVVMVTDYQGAYGTSGNDRFDNITLMGTPGTGIEEYGDPAQGYTLFPNPSRDNVLVNATVDGVKQVEICNMLGQTVSLTEMEGKKLPLNVSGMTNGIYFINVTEKSTGIRARLKFIKD